MQTTQVNTNRAVKIAEDSLEPILRDHYYKGELKDMVEEMELDKDAERAHIFDVLYNGEIPLGESVTYYQNPKIEHFKTVGKAKIDDEIIFKCICRGKWKIAEFNAIFYLNNQENFAVWINVEFNREWVNLPKDNQILKDWCDSYYEAFVD